MSASTDPDRTGRERDARLLAAAWRPAGLVYLAVCLAALLVGLHPQAIYPSRTEVQAAPLPALQALATAQVLFLLLVHPLIVLRRSERDAIRRYWAETLVESLTWLAVTVPFYAAAAWLADATATDVIRTLVCLLLLWPLTWSAGSILRAGKAARPAVILLMLIVAALPAAYYITREFLGVFPSDWLWDLAPATFIWQAAASRAGGVVPTPLWPLVLWLVVAAALAAAGMVQRRAASPPARRTG
jgi:hypothetical protein